MMFKALADLIIPQLATVGEIIAAAIFFTVLIFGLNLFAAIM